MDKNAGSIALDVFNYISPLSSNISGLLLTTVENQIFFVNQFVGTNLTSGGLIKNEGNRNLLMAAIVALVVLIIGLVVYFIYIQPRIQAVVKTGEDTIHICKDCNVAVNKEIINEQKVCPSCGNKKLEEKKAIEIGNIFKLGTRFSKPVGLEFTDENGKKKDVVMGCFGIGPSRLMGTVVEVCHDDKGIIWPEEISPFKAHLLEIKSKKPEVKSAAEKIYANLENKGIEVLYDDREAGAGEKFADADLIGCPYRIVISEKTLEKDCVEVKKRDSEKTELVKISEIIKFLNG